MNEMILTAPGAAVTPRPQLSETWPRFESYLKRRNVHDVTRQSYFVALRCFGDWMHDNAISAPTSDHIGNYIEWLRTPHARRQRTDRTSSAPAPIITMSAGTQARYLRAVKMFFQWTAAENIYPNIALDAHGAKVRADNTKRDPLQRDGALALLNSIDTSTDVGKRDYAMILLSITAGLRIIELQRANIGNIETFAGENILYIQGKGHEEADTYIKLVPQVYTAIITYLNTRKTKDPAAPLFAGIGNRNHGQRLTEPSISRIIKDRMRSAGYDTHRISAHSLRHTSVTFLLEAGATIQEAQHHARHASPVTTENVYAHNLEKQKQHTEQRVYDYLFGVEQDAATQAADLVKRMNAEQQRRALDLLKAIVG